VVELLNVVVCGSCVPDLTVLLRIEPQAALDRGQQRLAAGEADGADRFEGEGIDFQRTVASAYDDLAARHPERIRVIDAAGSVEQVHARVMEAVRSKGR
jgi:dTMP kinase